MTVKALKREALALFLFAVYFLVLYYLQGKESVTTWIWPSGMPETFTPRQVVSEIWSVCYFLAAVFFGAGSGICFSLASVLDSGLKI